MTEPIITNVFPKQPREKKWLQVSFAELLAAEGDTARAVDPIELDTVPAGIVVEQQAFDAVTGRFQILVSGGLDGVTYTQTMWIHTTAGQRLEHEIEIKVRER